MVLLKILFRVLTTGSCLEEAWTVFCFLNKALEAGALG